MPFLLGLNHRTAPVDIREKVAIPFQVLPDVSKQFHILSQASGLVCLSTCNRTEIYAEAKNKSLARQAIEHALQNHSKLEALNDYLYFYEGEEAVRHLFTVASGLDSMVQGEHEILSQVKQAYQAAHQAGITGKLLNVLFQRSLYVGKRVRSETALGDGASSVGSVAVGMAQRIFGSLKDRTIMILGAGQIAEVVAKQLLSQEAHSLLVANRTFERACELANEFNGTAMHFEEGLRQLAHVDIVICSTAAPHSIISPAHIHHIMAERKGRSLFLIDIAMPRDVDPKVNDIENVYLYNIDDLQQIVNENQTRRAEAARQAEQIVDTETREFIRWLRAHHSGLLSGLRHNPSSPLP